MTEVHYLNTQIGIVRIEGTREDIDEAVRSVGTDDTITEWLERVRENCEVEVNP